MVGVFRSASYLSVFVGRESPVLAKGTATNGLCRTMILLLVVSGAGG